MADKKSGVDLMNDAAVVAEAKERKRSEKKSAPEKEEDPCPHCGSMVKRMADNADPEKRDKFVKGFKKAIGD